MWDRMTIQQACQALDYDWPDVDKAMPHEIRRLVLEVAMFASARDDILGNFE